MINHNRISFLSILCFINIYNINAKVEKITNVLAPVSETKNYKRKHFIQRRSRMYNDCDVTLDIEGNFVTDEYIDLKIPGSDNIKRYIKEINSDLFEIVEKNADSLTIRILKECNKISIPMFFRQYNNDKDNKEFYMYGGYNAISNSKRKRNSTKSRYKKNDFFFLKTNTMYHLKDHIDNKRYDQNNIKYEYKTLDSKSALKTPIIFDNNTFNTSQILWGDINVRCTNYANFFCNNSLKKKFKMLNKFVRTAMQEQNKLFGDNYYNKKINVICTNEKPLYTTTAAYNNPWNNTIVVYNNKKRNKIYRDAQIIFHELTHRFINSYTLSCENSSIEKTICEGLTEYFSFKGLSKVMSKKKINSILKSNSKNYYSNYLHGRYEYDKGLMFSYYLSRQIKSWSNNTIVLSDIVNKLIRSNNVNSTDDAISQYASNTHLKDSLVNRMIDTTVTVFNERGIGIDKSMLQNIFNDYLINDNKVPYKKINIKSLF